MDSISALSTIRSAKFFALTGRVLLALALLMLFGVWMTQLRGGPVLGFTQEHLFSDATVLALLGIGCLLDALIHSKGL